MSDWNREGWAHWAEQERRQRARRVAEPQASPAKGRAKRSGSNDDRPALLLLLRGGPISWADVPLSMSGAALSLIESGHVELVSVQRKSYLRLPERLQERA